MGFFSNFSISIVLIAQKKILSHSLYKYLLVKAIIDVIICLFGIGYFKTNCAYCSVTNTYAILIYQWYAIRINLKTLFMISSFHEIFLIVQRYLVIQNSSKWFMNIKLKFYVTGIVLGSFLVSIPSFFAIEIQPEEKGDLHYWRVSKFGKTIMMKAYAILCILPETVVPSIVLVVMNIVTLRAFKKRLKIKARIKKQQKIMFKKSEIRYTRIILIMSTLFVITRLGDSIGSFINRSIILLEFDKESNQVSIANCFRQITIFFYFSLHSFDMLLFAIMDTRFSGLVKKIFLKKV